MITNFKPGTMDDWGLGYEDVAARNPRVVYAAGSAFGPEGPDAHREGADLSAQAAGGLINATGRDDGEPTPIAVTIADHISSLNLVSACWPRSWPGTAPGAGSASTCRCWAARSGPRPASTRTTCRRASCRAARTGGTR